MAIGEIPRLPNQDRSFFDKHTDNSTLTIIFFLFLTLIITITFFFYCWEYFFFVFITTKKLFCHFEKSDFLRIKKFCFFLKEKKKLFYWNYFFIKGAIFISSFTIVSRLKFNSTATLFAVFKQRLWYTLKHSPLFFFCFVSMKIEPDCNVDKILTNEHLFFFL